MKKNVLVKKYNGLTWDELYPVTKANNVYLEDGKNVQETIDNSGVKVFDSYISYSNFVPSGKVYTQDIPMTGLKDTDIPIADVKLSGNYDEDMTCLEEWSKIYRIISLTNFLRVYATEIPSITLPFQLKVVR